MAAVRKKATTENDSGSEASSSCSSKIKDKKPKAVSSKESLKELQARLLLEAKNKITTSPVPVSPAATTVTTTTASPAASESITPTADERITISQRTGYIQVNRSSTDEKLAAAAILGSAEVAPPPPVVVSPPTSAALGASPRPHLPMGVQMGAALSSIHKPPGPPQAMPTVITAGGLSVTPTLIPITSGVNTRPLISMAPTSGPPSVSQFKP